MSKFSLIVPTYGRIKEFEIFLESLKKQTYKNFELIVVDQNKHNSILDITQRYEEDIDIKYIKSNKLGLSYNRNLGINSAKGSIIAFPDDDCEYDEKTLETVNKFFEESSYDFYTCKVIDKVSAKQFGKSECKDTEVKYNNVMKNCVSISIFIKYIDKNDIIFDEKLGVGSIYPSGEESDLVFSLLHKGYTGYYYSNNYIYHPYKENDDTRVKGDSLGLGALMKKEIIYRKNIKMLGFYICRLIRPVVGIFVMPKRRTYFCGAIKYRVIGFVKYKN